MPIPRLSERHRHMVLWLARALVAAVFILAGVATLWAPVDYLAKHLPWTRPFSADFVRLVGALDLVGGLGIALPLRGPLGAGLTLAAALGCAALQACALLLHLQRAEPQFLPLNVLLLVVSLLIFRALWRARRSDRIVSATSRYRDLS